MLDFKKITSVYKEESLKKLQDLIKINSIYDESTVSDENPYGIGVTKALNYMKELAIEKGFNATIYANRVLEITYGSEGKEIGIFGHLDVVPVAGEWKYDPFSATLEQDKLFGRGTSDDKGPVIAAFYGLLALKENNLIDGYKVRFVCGGDEERGSSCLEYYFNELKKPHVDAGFTPDGDFPLIYGEKGITNYKIEGNIHLNDEIISFEGGLAKNIVIDEAKVTLKNASEFVKFLDSKKVNYKVNNNQVTILGKAAHGSTPELGINAGVILLENLGEFYNDDVLKILGHQYADYNGRNFKGFFETENLHETTYCLGLMSYDGHKLSLTINFRYPENVEVNKLIPQIQELTPLPIYVLSTSDYLYFDPNHPMIKTLYNAYTSETNDFDNKPFTIGGGTYAKEAKNIVAFGSKFPSKYDFIHEANEKIDLEDFYGSMPIYAHGIYDLGHMK